MIGAEVTLEGSVAVAVQYCFIRLREQFGERNERISQEMDWHVLRRLAS